MLKLGKNFNLYFSQKIFFIKKKIHIINMKSLEETIKQKCKFLGNFKVPYA